MSRVGVPGVGVVLLSMLGLAPTLLSPAGAAETPRAGGTIVTSVSADPPTLNPALTTDANANFVAVKLFNGLTVMDRAEGMGVKGDLAEAWEISPDGKTYRFRLHRNVRWHDGRPFTSADVKFTYQEILAKHHPTGRVGFGVIDAIETPDDHTVVFRLKEPYGPFLFQTNSSVSPILPRHLYEGTDILKNPRNTANPVGTGPFKLAEQQRGSHLVLVKNPEYFKAGRPYLDRLVIRVIPEATGKVLAFQKGEIDLIQGYWMPRDQAARLKALPNVASVDDVSFSEALTLFFNLKGTPALASLKVRQAIAHATDRKFILEKAYFGLGREGTSVIPSSIRWAYNSKVPTYAFDLARANALLDEAGFPRKDGGSRLTLRVAYDPKNVMSARPSEVFAEQLKRVGIDARLDAMERMVMLKKVFVEYDYDLYIHNLATTGDPAIGVSRLYVCDNIRPAPFVNVERYCNPKVDELFKAGASRADPKDRAKFYFEVQEILARELPTIPLLETGEANVFKPTIHGLFQSYSPHERWDEVWLSK